MKTKYVLDAVDDKILGFIFDEGMPIMKLTRIVNIAHNNLLHRLKRLEKEGYIYREKVSKKRDILIKQKKNKVCDYLQLKKEKEVEIIDKDILTIEKKSEMGWGEFTSAKKMYRWIKENEPVNFNKIHKLFKISPLSFWTEFILPRKYEIIIRIKK